MPPRITQNDKREQTARIPNQLERVQRETSTTPKTVKQLSQSQQGQTQFSANAQSAFGVNPSIATMLLNALNPAAKAIKAGVEVRDRIDKDKFEDVVMFAQNTSANKKLGPQEKLKLVSDAYNNFKPLSKKYQIAAHTQKTKVDQELNGIQDKLLFSDWSTRTFKASLNYPINPLDDSMSREEFLSLAAKDLREDQPKFTVQSLLWEDSQQVQMYKKQYENLNSFANASADIILKSMLENPETNFQQAGAYNVFQATLSESLSSNGIDPKTVLENDSIMEGIQYKFQSNRVLANQVSKIRSDRDRVISETTNSVMDGYSSGPWFNSDSGLGPMALAKVITTEAPNTSPLDPLNYLSRVNSQLSSISSELDPTQITTNLSQYPINSYSPQYREIIQNVRENPEYLSDSLYKEDADLHKLVRGALYETEDLFRQDLMLAAGDDLKLAFVTENPENAGTSPADLIPKATKSEKIMATLTSSSFPDDITDQKKLIVSSAERAIALLELKQADNLLSPDYTIQEDPVFEINNLKNLLQESRLDSDQINLEATQKLVNLLENDIDTPQNIYKETRATSFFLKKVSQGVPLGGTETQTGGHVLPALIFSYANAYPEEAQGLLEETEGYLNSSLRNFITNLPEGSPLRKEFTEVLETNDLVATLKHIEDRLNDMSGAGGEEWKVDFKTKYGEFVTGLARWTQNKTGLISITTDGSSFTLSDSNKTTEYVSGLIASNRQKDITTGVDQSHVSEEAVNIFVGRLDNLTEQIALNYDEKGGQFDFEQFKNENSTLFAAVSNITSSAPSIKNKKLKQAIARFQLTSIGLPKDMISRITNEKNLLTKDSIVKNTLIAFGPLLTELPPERRKIVKDAVLTFQSFFPSSTTGFTSNVFDPITLVDRSNMTLPAGIQAFDSRDIATESFALKINKPANVLEDPIKNSADGFLTELNESVIKGALSDPTIFGGFRDSGENEAALQTAIQEAVQGEITGVPLDLGRSSTDVIYDVLEQNNMQVSVNLVRVPKGQGSPEATKLAKLHLIENMDDLADKKINDLDYEYGFETQVIPNTSGSSQVIKLNRFDPGQQESFKGKLETNFGVLGDNVANINTAKENTVVPAGTFHFMNKQFENLLGVDYGRGIPGGSATDPYRDLIKIAFTERGLARLVGGRRSLQEGVPSIEEGPSLFGLDQAITIFAMTEQIALTEGVDKALDFMKDVHDQHSRTNQSRTNSLIAYESIEGDMVVNTGFSVPMVIDENVQTRIKELRKIALNSYQIRTVPEANYRFYNYEEFMTQKEKKKRREEERQTAELRDTRGTSSSRNYPNQ